MNDDFRPMIMRSIETLFANVRATFDAVSEEQMQKAIGRWPLWKQFYHVLHSMDQWFVNPYRYEHPSFHTPGLHAFDGERTPVPSPGLSKAQLVDYFEAIAAKVTRHFESLDDRELLDKPEDSPFSRLELLIGQMRHGMYNIGLIHGMLREDTGSMPEYVGLSLPVEPDKVK